MSAAEGGGAPAVQPAGPAAAPRPALIPLGGDAAVCDGDTCTVP